MLLFVMQPTTHLKFWILYLSSILIISVDALGTDSTIPTSPDSYCNTKTKVIFMNNIGKVVLIVTIPPKETLHKCAFIIQDIKRESLAFTF